MKRLSLTLTLILIAAIGAGCASGGGSRTPLLSKHQLFTLSPGKHWQLTQQLDDKAEIQIGRKDGRAFVLVYAYDRNQMQYPGLKPFAKLTTEQLMQGLEKPKAQQPIVGHIDNNPTVVYALSAESQGAQIIYFSAAIEGKHAIYWVVAWCLASDYDKVGDDLVDAFFSLRET